MTSPLKELINRGFSERSIKDKVKKKCLKRKPGSGRKRFYPDLEDSINQEILPIIETENFISTKKFNEIF